jgi:hypothetical protein
MLREHRRSQTKQGSWRLDSVERPLFGPYLFVSGDVNWLSTRYVAKLLTGQLSDRFMDVLIAEADEHGVIVGRALPRVTNGRCIDFVANKGDLCNVMLLSSIERLHGVIEDVSKVEKTGFVTVLLDMLGRQCKVEMHYTQIGRLPPSGANRRERRKGMLELA